MPSSRFVLLTGAGFTHNFGAPLASELWAAILNHEAVQNTPRVREAVLSDFDFESVYHRVISGDYTPEEKAALSRGVADAYEHVDRIVRSWGFRRDAPYPVNVYKVQEMIAAFAGSEAEPGFFFTLNQDLFIERHYYNGERPNLPGIRPSMDWFTTHFRGPVQAHEHVALPSADSLGDERTLLGRARFYYLKLHGSSNWRSADGSQRMVIGQGKETQIGKEPLLSKYFETFARVLREGNRRLLIIGYGFRDVHVNKILAEAIGNHGLRLFLMAPDAPASVCNALQSDELGKQIWSGLGGYFQYPLLRMFPGDQSETAEWQAFKDQYFEGQFRRRWP